ncbi:MAG: glycoside hydrolase family 3 N-terminal domain-containing protein [Solirubrobacteraceae bacterium]
MARRGSVRSSLMLALALVLGGLAGAGCGSSHPVEASLGSGVPTTPTTATAGVTSSTGTANPKRPARARPALQLALPGAIGEMIVARFAGPTPPASLLARIREGQVGGVILFGENVTGGREATQALTAELQAAATAGRRSPLLIMADQEGGEVKRLTWAPPALAPARMTSTNIAAAEGQAAGSALRSAGINLDLAPVADVEHFATSFLGSRAFGDDSSQVTLRACAFAQGLAAAGVGYTLKHFPGLGRATSNTDLGPTVIEAGAEQLRQDYQPYLACGHEPQALIMVSSGTYPALASRQTPAVLAQGTYATELGVAGVGGTPTISDDLEAGALRQQTAVAVRAADAGLDLLLFAGTEGGSERGYAELLAAAQRGEVPVGRIAAADAAIARLKQTIAGGG